MQISGIILSQGYPELTKATIESFPFDDVVVMDYSVDHSNNFRNQQKRPFNALFKNGFAHEINLAATFVKNDIIYGMGVGNLLVSDIKPLPDGYDSFCAFRIPDNQKCPIFYNRKKTSVKYCIHEELEPCKYWDEPIFSIGDTEKDDPFFEEIKHIVYLEQARKLAEGEGQSNLYWVELAKKQYTHIKAEIIRLGQKYTAFQTGDLELYLKLSDQG